MFRLNYFLFVFSSFTYALLANEPYAKVQELKGTPFIIRQLKKQYLKVNDTLLDGDKIKTDSNSEITLIKLSDQSTISIKANTYIKLNKHHSSPFHKLEKELFTTGSNLNKKNFHITTPKAVIGILRKHTPLKTSSEKTRRERRN